MHWHILLDAFAAALSNAALLVSAPAALPGHSSQPNPRCQVHLPCSPSHQIWWLSTGRSRHNLSTPLIFPSLPTPQVIYDTKSQHGTLEWTNDSNFGGDGTLKLTAKSVMDADSIKKMPVGCWAGHWGGALYFCRVPASMLRALAYRTEPTAYKTAHLPLTKPMLLALCHADHHAGEDLGRGPVSLLALLSPDP